MCYVLNIYEYESFKNIRKLMNKTNQYGICKLNRYNEKK